MFAGVPRMASVLPGQTQVHLWSKCEHCKRQKVEMGKLSSADMRQLYINEVDHPVKSGPVTAFPTTIDGNGVAHVGVQTAAKLRTMIRAGRK